MHASAGMVNVSVDCMYYYFKMSLCNTSSIAYTILFSLVMIFRSYSQTMSRRFSMQPTAYAGSSVS